MQRILTASKDTYITNKIINNSFRATDSNAGSAGTLDLFKLYNENIITGETTPKEFSRLLIKFPIQEVSQMDSDKIIDLNDSSFKAYVKLSDVYGGQTTPNNFKAILFPLSQSFDEGRGLDIVSFSDLDATNYITASIQNGAPVLWKSPGAMASGSLGDENIDIIVSGTLNPSAGSESLCVEQFFESGYEDLFMDVTTIVSGTAANLIPNHGFLIAFSGSFESNEKSYFVKRFSSRNAYRASQRPQMIVKYDDSIFDNHQGIIFNVSSSLYLQNYHQDDLANILSGSSATPLTGENCMVLKLESGSYKKTFNVSQALNGRHRMTGVYSASFAVDSFSSHLYEQANITGSITFNEVWTNPQETVTYLSSSLKVNRENRRVSNTKNQNNVLVTVLNVNEEYRRGQKVKIRVFAEDRDRDVISVKTPLEKKSQIFQNMHFRIRDVVDGTVLMDFDKTNNSSRLSTDNDGMFFTFYTDSLPPGRTYSFDFLIVRDSADTVIKDAASKFRII